MIEILQKFKTIILNYEIILWDSEPASYRFKARITFIDNSILIVKDYLFPNARKYSFHWQDKNGNLIIRWDNAKHWVNIDTYPHHKHEKDQVSPSKEVSLEDIMSYIYEVLKK